MSWAAIIAGAVALALAATLSRLVARLLGAFALAAGVLLALHARTDPAEAVAGLAALGGAFALRRPLRRLLTGGLV
ncbi:hypothetical protein [Roseisalinus antarcticus]|uniref:Uncharacterized protein n=1 Tax=Roseisalinus antarcticus TaxID=254357 RepID=A0A1Y5SID0_9RHOB|nr:hypothetical protein [Roseisalinus antarcticus]SLN39816.1 hypothetical protein ROA7023_01532 [Roseisalinus antarcticus]